MRISPIFLAIIWQNLCEFVYDSLVKFEFVLQCFDEIRIVLAILWNFFSEVILTKIAFLWSFDEICVFGEERGGTFFHEMDIFPVILWWNFDFLRFFDEYLVLCFFDEISVLSWFFDVIRVFLCFFMKKFSEIFLQSFHKIHVFPQAFGKIWQFFSANYWRNSFFSMFKMYRKMAETLNCLNIQSENDIPRCWLRLNVLQEKIFF